MTERTLPAALRTSLIANDPYRFAHLIKFERPIPYTIAGAIAEKATDYTYITDGAYDVEWDDGSKDSEGNANGVQIYRANKVKKVSSITESTEAKATSLTLDIDAVALGASVLSVGMSFQTSGSYGSYIAVADGLDLIEAGFREGDKVYISSSSVGPANNGKYVIIKSFRSERQFTYTAVDAITDVSNNSTYTVELAAEEVVALILGKENAAYSSYLNRDVFIYKTHTNVETNVVIGEPYQIFKGIIAGSKLKEDPKKGSTMSWTLSSHWADFVRVSGRMTNDEMHRALDSNGNPDFNATVRPEYGSDLGFAHANTAINLIATYNDKETKYKFKKTGLFGWGKGKTVEYQVDVERTTDLNFNLSSKFLPVVYGVQKIDSIPFFVDTLSSSSKDIYVAYALCEGPISSIFDVYIEGNGSICLDKVDYDSRAQSGANYDGDAVEVLCKGRMDKGDVLDSYSSNTGSNIPDYNDLAGVYSGDYGRAAVRAWRTAQQRNSPSTTLQNPVYQGTDTGVGDIGMLDRNTHTWTKPSSISLTLHTGGENQLANNTLVGLARSNSFKLQNSYYTGTDSYWGVNHRVLDTAYVVGKFVIAPDETTIPELDFLVRGKGIECYNYDDTYEHPPRHNSAAFGTAQTNTDWVVGDVVSLKRSSDGAAMASGTAITIADKWSFIDPDGSINWRFNFDVVPTLLDTASPAVAITAFYMQKDSDTSKKWHMETYDHVEETGTVATALTTTINTSAAATGSAGTNNGIQIVLDSANTALMAALAESGNLSFFAGAGNYWEGIDWSTFDFTFVNNGSNLTLDDVGTMDDIEETLEEIIVADGIVLVGSEVRANYYLNEQIQLTRYNSDGVPYTQTRKIKAYTATTKVAIVDRAWDPGYTPKSGDKYTIGRLWGKGDSRVSINPAMQLLDYTSNKRYGRGLSIAKDIDLTSFKDAAKKCDTRSTVSVLVVTPATAPTVGAIYKYGTQFTGTVESIISAGSLSSVAHSLITFNNVWGKFGQKANNWKSFKANDLIWWNDQARVKALNGTLLPVANTNLTVGLGAVITTANLTKVSGTGTTPLVADLTQVSGEGNPYVKGYSAAYEYSPSGYSLYDSDNVKYWKYVGWDSSDQRCVTRHQMNQTINTSVSVFENINAMLRQFNGILREGNGKYQLDVRSKATTFTQAEKIYAEDIIGSISISDQGLKKSYNSVNAGFIDPQNKFQSRSISYFNSVYLKEDKAIPKQGSLILPGITNYFNSRFQIKQYLDESRYGLSISFTMAPKGALLMAGSIVTISYPRFGWVQKEFRVSNLSFMQNGLVQVKADEHNDAAYVVEASTPQVFGQITPQAPTISQIPIAPAISSITNSGVGGIILVWTNGAGFKAETHTTEIWRSASNNRTNSVLVATENGNTWTDTVTDDDPVTAYYWIRHKVVVSLQNRNSTAARLLYSTYYPTTSVGVTGVSASAVGQRGPGRWHIAVSAVPTTASAAATAWTNGTGEQPTSAFADDQAWFYTGTIANPTAQKVWLYNGTTWVNQVEAVDGGLLVDGTVSTSEIGAGTILATNIDQTAAGGRFGEVVADIGTFSVVDTDVLNANSVIAREVQVFPVGGTAPTISGTTLTGAGIDLKQDGDLYVGNFSANKYMFWDQSEGVMTFRGALNAGDISAGSIDADRITTRSLTADKIVANSLTAAEIGVGALTAVTIASDAITTDKLAADAITTDKIAANAVTANEITVSNLSSLTANLGTMTAGSMEGGSLKGGSVPEASSAPSGSEAGTFMDLTGGRMVLGNASKYIWWDGTNLTINGVTISNAALSGSTGVATETYVDNAIDALVDNAPGTLNTLNEIAAALDDDADFHTAVTTSLSGKVATNSQQSLSNVADAMTISGSTITLARGNGGSDTVVVPNTNTQRPIDDTPVNGSTTTSISSNWAFDNVKTAVPVSALFTDTNTQRAIHDTPVNGATTTSISSNWAFDNVKTAVPTSALFTDTNTTYSVGDGGLTTKDFTTILYNKLNGGTFITDNSQIANSRGYITSADNGDADQLEGISASGFVQVGSNQALGTGGTVLTNSGSTISLVRAGGTTDTVTVPNDNTTYSTATSSTLGLVKIGYAESGKNYPVELSSGKMFVNVPWVDTDTNTNTHRAIHDTPVNGATTTSISSNWAFDNVKTAVPTSALFTDTNTTYTAGTGITLTGTAFSNASPDQVVAIAGAGATTVTGTYPSFTITSTDTNTNTTSFNIQAESNAVENISAGETVKFTGTGAATVTRSGNTINIASVDTNTNYYVSSLSWATGTGILTLNRSGAAALTIDLDGRYSTTDTNTWRGISDSISTTNSAISASQTAVKAAYDRSWPNYYLSGITKSSNTLTFAVSGATDQTYTFGSNAFNSTAFTTNTGTVSTASASGGLSATVTGANVAVATTGNLAALASATTMPSLSVDFLEAGTISAGHISADTIVADHIDANAITAEQMQISNTSSGSAGIFMDYNSGNSRIDIRDASALRVRIGYLG